MDALTWPGLHVDKEQRSNYIQSLAKAFPYDRYDAHCTGWSCVWHSMA